VFPIWLGFRGGKGVATGLGVLIAANPPTGLACCAVWAVVAKLAKISSAAALSAFLAAPLLMWAITGSQDLTMLAGIVAVLVFIRHHDNIRRLLAGTEPKIGQK
jgi:glycerol-3-phosphate acyltransferase PlsY